jgi:acylphosphatase
MIRLTVYFSGRVQGVGFRYTAVQISRRYKVAGMVENLPDGRVRLVVEGTSEQATGFVDDLARKMSGYISDHTVDQSPATGEFGTPGRDTLTIRHG